jgi:hypothetical protein
VACNTQPDPPRDARSSSLVLAKRNAEHRGGFDRELPLEASQSALILSDGRDHR